MQRDRDLPPPYGGSILVVDVGTGRTERLETRRYVARFLGGRALAAALYFERAPARGAFDHPDCPVILSVGPLSGAPGGLGGSRWGIYGKSPLPRGAHGGRDHYCYGNLGGAFGAALRHAGHDALVLVGKAREPVVVHVRDDAVALEPAKDLWGKSTIEARAAALRGAPRTAKSLAIGPAGERGVPIATVFADGDASCSGGMGAALGVKGVKAITVAGSARRVAVADREALRRIDREIRALGRGNVKVWGLDFMAQGPQTRKAPCFGCMGHCLRVRYRARDGTTGKFMCQSRFFYMEHAWGYYGEDTEVPFFANRLCDAYGVDTWEVQALLEWLLRCHADGVLDAREVGLPLDAVGSLEFIEALVRQVALREGMGDLLCQGAAAAAARLGPAAAARYVPTDPYDPRYCTVNALLFPFETREPIQQLHEAGLVLAQWSSWAKGVEGAHISSAVFRGIAERFWGSAEAADMTTWAGKAEAARRIQDRQHAKEAMGLCDWMFPIVDRPRSVDPVGDPSYESRVLSAALGARFEESDLARFGARSFMLQRAILLREGHRARHDDRLPETWHRDPIETHVADPELLAPGPAGRVTSQTGRRVDERAFERLRDEYYGLRGWDVPTGLPTRAGLLALDLPEAAGELAGRGLLAPKARPAPLAVRLRYRIEAEAERRVAALRPRAEALVSRLRPAKPSREVLSAEAVEALLQSEQKKFNHPAVGSAFAGWNKVMEYAFPDAGLRYRIRFEDGVAGAPEPVPSETNTTADIRYEMDTWVLRAMADGTLSGKTAYLRRLLRVQAQVSDMMALGALARVPPEG